jgi:RecA-family ATPase
MSVDLTKGTFFNNEAKVGGGVLALIEHQGLVDHAGAWDWFHDQFPETKASPNGHDPGAAHIVQTYDYQGADRALVFQVCRKRPKAFLQRRPDPTAEGGWNWSTKGIRPIPYKLPELIEAVAAARVIYIVEGERDVDRLRADGLASTSNSGGAGKWAAALNPYFKGADVVIVGDNDGPGREHAQAVAKQLAPVAARVRLLDLGAVWPACPEKGDASDYLDAGHTVADLEALAAALPDYGQVQLQITGVFKASSLEGLPIPPRVWHVAGLVPARTVTMLGGDGGVGKSTLALQLAICTAAEQAWLGSAVRPGRVLYLSAEDDRDELHRRTDQIAVFYGLALERLAALTLWPLIDEDALLVTGAPGHALETTPRWQDLQGLVAAERPSLIVLDSLADFFGGGENERPQVRQFVRLLRSLVAPIDAALVLLAHPSLTGLSSGSGLSGSTAWNNSVRSRLYLSTPADDDGGASAPELRTLAVRKSNYSQSGVELKLRWAAGAFINDDPIAGSALDRQISADRVDEQFLAMLEAFTVQGRFVSHNTGHAYAPALFARDPDAKGTTSKGFEAAMNRLFRASRISAATRGPRSRQISYIRRVEPANDEA